MPYVEKRIKCGRVLEIIKYNKPPKAARQEDEPTDSTEDQQAANQRKSILRLTRYLRRNFCRENRDALYSYTSDRDMTEAQAMKEARNLRDRLRRKRERLGLSELKAVVVVEKQSKWHFHVVMNGGLTLEQAQEVWNVPKFDKAGKPDGWKLYRGGMNVRTLDGQETFIRLARYMLGAEKMKKGKPEAGNVKELRPKGSRRWNATKNLKKPEVDIKPIKPPKCEQPKAPKGYVLIEDESCARWDGFGNVYIKITCYKAVWKPEPEEKRRKKRE